MIMLHSLTESGSSWRLVILASQTVKTGMSHLTLDTLWSLIALFSATKAIDFISPSHLADLCTYKLNQLDGFPLGSFESSLYLAISHAASPRLFTYTFNPVLDTYIHFSYN